MREHRLHVPCAKVGFSYGLTEYSGVILVAVIRAWNGKLTAGSPCLSQGKQKERQEHHHCSHGLHLFPGSLCSATVRIEKTNAGQ